ncbi:Replication protein [Bacteroidales bacterium Barb4]|nr:Replication protein [Bacteroidales bacterium Barb4]
MTEDVLQDISSTGKVRPWREHKMHNELLALAYDEVNPDKAARLRTCATELGFVRTADGKLKLDSAWFCRVRLCPMCGWRKSLKVGAQMTQIMDAIKADRKLAYILVTFTVANCQPDELDATLTKMLHGFNNMTKRKAVKAATHGYYRGMEITHNIDSDTYHPHIHAVFAVNLSYFTNVDYLAQYRWTELWRTSINASYNPVVDVRRVKGDTAKAVAEVAKYAVKSSDYIIPDDWNLTVDTVRLLDAVLNNRRFVAFGGIFADYHRKLHLDDAEDGDLIHTDDSEADTETAPKVAFVWHTGYRQYQGEPLK